MNDQNKKNKHKPTPLPDGDTRPDKNQEPDPAIGTAPIKKQQKTTAARNSDVNSLEDFKDAK
jgi:hypothetical protein